MNAGALRSPPATRSCSCTPMSRLPAGARIAAIAQRACAKAAMGTLRRRLEGRSRWLPLVAAIDEPALRRSPASAPATRDCSSSAASFDAVGGFPAIGLMEDIALSATLQALAGAGASPRIGVARDVRTTLGRARRVADDRRSMWRLAFRVLARRRSARARAAATTGRSAPACPVLQVFAKAPIARPRQDPARATIGDEAAAAVRTAGAGRAHARHRRHRGTPRRRRSKRRAVGRARRALGRARRLGGAAVAIALRTQRGADLGDRMQRRAALVAFRWTGPRC